jgi:hypothetical protein
MRRGRSSSPANRDPSSFADWRRLLPQGELPSPLAPSRPEAELKPLFRSQLALRLQTFKTGAAWQPHARSVRLRRRSARAPPGAITQKLADDFLARYHGATQGTRSYGRRARGSPDGRELLFTTFYRRYIAFQLVNPRGRFVRWIHFSTWNDHGRFVATPPVTRSGNSDPRTAPSGARSMSRLPQAPRAVGQRLGDGLDPFASGEPLVLPLLSQLFRLTSLIDGLALVARATSDGPPRVRSAQQSPHRKTLPPTVRVPYGESVAGASNLALTPRLVFYGPSWAEREFGDASAGRPLRRSGRSLRRPPARIP